MSATERQTRRRVNKSVDRFMKDISIVASLLPNTKFKYVYAARELSRICIECNAKVNQAF